MPGGMADQRATRPTVNAETVCRAGHHGSRHQSMRTGSTEPRYPYASPSAGLKSVRQLFPETLCSRTRRTELISDPDIFIMETQSQTQAPQPQPKRANTPDENKITRGHSCILCQQRKVKCDKQKPCSNCIKARAECVPSAPAQPRRRKRKLTETDLADRLKRYEHLLRKHGVKLDDEDEDEMKTRGEREGSHPHPDEFLAMHAPRPKGGERGALFANKENFHYVEK